MLLLTCGFVLESRQKLDEAFRPPDDRMDSTSGGGTVRLSRIEDYLVDNIYASILSQVRG